jgi:hypothetical protein
MSTISRVKPEEARYNPEAEFGHPSSLLESVALTRGQKIAALDRWAFALQRRIDAGSEGMPGSEWSAEDLQLLEAVRQALATLRSETGKE